MAGRRPHEAVLNYIDPFQKALSCVCRAVVQVGSYNELNAIHALTVESDDGAPIRGYSDLILRIEQRYRIARSDDRGPYTVSTAAYSYRVCNADDRTILAYHWHPSGASHILEPHFHLGSASNVTRAELIKAHLPTSRVAIEDVIRVLIREFGVKPVRTDWAEILDKSQTEFEAARTWSGRGPLPT